MKLLLSSFLLLILFGCSSSEDSPNDPNTISNNLHLSFTTPDWDKFINCDLLDLFPVSINATTNYVSATSASTKETFCFSVPKDSSVMVLPSNLKKYAVKEYFANTLPFEFSQKLPITDGNSSYLVSLEGLSDGSYNEVVEINYIGHETNYSIFKVKCRYKMIAKKLMMNQLQGLLPAPFILRLEQQGISSLY